MAWRGADGVRVGTLYPAMADSVMAKRLSRGRGNRGVGEKDERQS
jgi:hypothetical protein